MTCSCCGRCKRPCGWHTMALSASCTTVCRTGCTKRRCSAAVAPCGWHRTEPAWSSPVSTTRTWRNSRTTRMAICTRPKWSCGIRKCGRFFRSIVKETKCEVWFQAGRKNPSVSLRHINLNDDLLQWKSVEAPVATVSKDHILKSVSWLDDVTFGAIWMNRRQNQSVFQQCNAASNICQEVRFGCPSVWCDFSTFICTSKVFQTQEPNGWVDLSSLSCTPNDDRCFYIDYVDDWLNIYEFIRSTGARNPRIVAEFTVLGIYGYNAALNEMWVTQIVDDLHFFLPHVFSLLSVLFNIDVGNIQNPFHMKFILLSWNRMNALLFFNLISEKSIT